VHSRLLVTRLGDSQFNVIGLERSLERSSVAQPAGPGLQL
jgi:hypothetical protein